MSIAAMAWAWECDVKGTDKLVLLALADHADNRGICWPGKSGVAEKCGLGRRTVVASVQRMQDAGLIVSERRFRDDGSQTSDLLRLCIGVSSDAPPRAGNAHPPVQELHGGSAGAAHHEPSEEPKDEPNNTVEPEPDEDELVFDAWVESTGKTGRVVFDAKRREAVKKARALGFDQADLVDAVRGWKKSPHHRGENERQTVYNDLKLLLRDAEQIEKFRDLERGGRSLTLVPAVGSGDDYFDRAGFGS